MRQELDIVIIFVKILKLTHIISHRNANALASRKKEIRNIDFIFKILLSHCFSILVD